MTWRGILAPATSHDWATPDPLFTIAGTGEAVTDDRDQRCMQFLREAYTELKAAFGTRWSVLILIVAALVARIDWFLQFLPGVGVIQVVAGVPDWLLGILVLATLITFQAIAHAVKLRRMITPNFILSVDRTGPIVMALDRIYDSQGHLIKEYKSRYIRVKANTVSQTNIGDGVAFITALNKRSSHGNTEINLPQPVILGNGQPFTIYHALPKMVDFLKCDEVHNKLFVIGAWPLIMENILDDPATYTFTIMVNAGGVSRSKDIEITWTGRWDQVSARDVTGLG
jgi:hypothetical protein